MSSMSKKFIRCGRFFDGIQLEFRHNLNILIENDRISDVGENVTKPEDAEFVDLSNLTVTPGLIDAHVHFDFIGPYSFDDYAYRCSDEMKAMNILYCANKSLLGGFTTVRLIGTSMNGFGAVDARDSIASHRFAGSRIVVSPHFLGISGGHGDYSSFLRTNPALSDRMESLNPFTGHGADFYRKAVRKEVKYGADFIKIMATGGFASPYDDPAECQLDNSELQAIMDTAKQLGVPVTAHCYTSELAKNLINMGISGIEHGSLIDEEICDMMLEKGVYLCCTFQPYEEAVHMDPEKLSRKSVHFQRKLIKYGDQLRATRKLVIQKIMEDKMMIGYGTDMVSVYDNYECFREFSTWRRSGIPALRTLKAATSVNARILGNSQIGVLAPGKIADIAGWASDIENDIDAISQCAFVMKDGIIYKL